MIKIFLNWLVRGAFIFVLSMAVMQATGCATQIGKVEAQDGSSHTGIYVSFGQTTGPGGMKGGTISAPGATLFGQVAKAAADFASSVFGRPVLVQPVPETD